MPSVSVQSAAENMAPTTNYPGDLGYEGLRDAVASTGAAAMDPVFIVEPEGGPLSGIYIDAIRADRRQHYTCNCCRRFLDDAGSLATIDEDGNLTPLLWGRASGVMRNPAAKMHRAIQRGTIKGVWLTDSNVQGTPVTGEWTHFSFCLPDKASALHRHPLTTPGQKMAELREDHGILGRSIGKWSADTVRLAVELLTEDDLYRGDNLKPRMEWLFALHAKLAGAKGKRRDALLWRAVATAPAGWCKLPSSVAAPLLDDLAAGKSFADIARAHRAKMDPLAYRRTQALPSAAAVQQAEGIIAKMQAAGSLQRRWATIDDLELLWKPAQASPPDAAAGVFGAIRTRNSQPNPARVLAERDPKTVTWAVFAEDVLPAATRMQVDAPYRGGFCGLVAPVDPDAPRIIQWPNAVTWYYHNGGSAAAVWGLQSGWVDVPGVCRFPYEWSDAGNVGEKDPGAMFILGGANPSLERGHPFFTEQLLSDYHPARRVLEEYAKIARLSGDSSRAAVALTIGRTDKTPVKVKVWRDGSPRIYIIDRWR